MTSSSTTPSAADALDDYIKAFDGGGRASTRAELDAQWARLLSDIHRCEPVSVDDEVVRPSSLLIRPRIQPSTFPHDLSSTGSQASPPDSLSTGRSSSCWSQGSDPIPKQKPAPATGRQAEQIPKPRSRADRIGASTMTPRLGPVPATIPVPVEVLDSTWRTLLTTPGNAAHVDSRPPVLPDPGLASMKPANTRDSHDGDDDDDGDDDLEYVLDRWRKRSAAIDA
ncbi:hypothetical protein PBRA_004635 [Plasmodiophora brassicae]|uniref:Uncharacterized protein n=1 Tax=Plasmodiophora brassicae TaxID=37360 RepID=A0A0G4ILF8_PLABS|nr:hypothetical protein PBRA_004635 [Plasmodiophora brassicae]